LPRLTAPHRPRRAFSPRVSEALSALAPALLAAARRNGERIVRAAVRRPLRGGLRV